MSAIERDKGYRQLLGELTLHPDDRADLVRRGFSHAQIELSGFVSVRAYQRLQGRYSELLPGILTGKVLTTNDGYLCPVRNTEGLIVACQIRLRVLPEGDKNRYRWLSTKEQTLQLDGEIPLAVFQPTGKPEGIALAEGTGAKPFLVSQRLNLFTIGAAGGQWASSPELFRSILEKAALEIDGKEIKIFPDAGDILNQSVMARWQRVIALLKEWGWSVVIGWWGQANKTHFDVDELEDFSAIQYISPREFFDLGQPSAATQGFSSSDDTPEWKRRDRANWRKNRRFTNAIKSCTKWINWEKPPANTIFFGKAGLGRGKTTNLIGWVDQWKIEDLSFLCFGYRNSLLLQLCSSEMDEEGKQKGLGFYHLHEHSGMMMKSASGEGLALCVDSLWRFSPEDFDGKIIILDEVQSVIKHLLHSSTIRNRDKIIGLFREAIKRSRQVIF